MAKKPLPTPEQLRQLLRYEPETGKLYWRERTPDMFTDGIQSASHACARWNARYSGKEAFAFKDKLGYFYGRVFDRHSSAHRVVFALHHGRWPAEVDHINGDPSDNRIANLRETTRSQNLLNTASRPGSSRYKGVYWNKRDKRWQAYVKVGKVMKNVGMFTDEVEAAKARDAAILMIDPAHCRLNFPAAL